MHEYDSFQKSNLNNRCLHQLFEAQANKTPNAIAIQFQEESLTYQQLNSKANKLAHFLIAQGAVPEMLISIIMERSIEMIISVLAVLKSGAAYVPIDPSFPQKRLEFMIDDTKSPMILTSHIDLLERKYGKSVISPNDIIYQTEFPSKNLNIFTASHNLAYVIYTSGSTGRPKGVMIEHEAVVCLIQGLQYRYSLDLEESVLFQSPFNFDASVEEIFWPLCFGGTLLIAPPGIHNDLNQLLAYIRNYNVNNIQFVPSLLEAFFQLPRANECGNLRRIFSGGEILHSKIKDAVLKALPAVELYNDYGSTETSSQQQNVYANRSKQTDRPFRQVTLYRRYLLPRPGWPG